MRCPKDIPSTNKGGAYVKNGNKVMFGVFPLQYKDLRHYPTGFKRVIS